MFEALSNARGASSSPIWCAPPAVSPAKWKMRSGNSSPAGLVTADGFENLRALIDPKRRRGEGRGRSHGRAMPPDAGLIAASRPSATDVRRTSPDNYCCAGACSSAICWRAKRVAALARSAAGSAPNGSQGEIRGGRFVSGFTGEQFAPRSDRTASRGAPVRAIARKTPSTSRMRIPLAGILLPGPRVNTLSIGTRPLNAAAQAS